MASILVVEDDHLIRRMLCLRLKVRGHELDTAENGLEGYEKARRGRYGLVLMDMHMPVVDGHEAVRRLRGDGYRGTIVAVTASAMSKDSRAALKAGCDHFISKPIDAHFEDRIDAILAQAGGDEVAASALETSGEAF